MLTICRLFSLVISILFVCRASGAQDHLPKPLVVHAGSGPSYIPFQFVNEKGDLVGFGPDLLELISRYSNLKIDIQVEIWNEIRKKLESGAVDLVPIMAKSPDRAKFVDFLDTLIVSYDAIFIRRDEKTIGSEADLAGRRVIVHGGDIAHEYLLKTGYPITVVTAPTLTDAFKMLEAGAGDAVVAPQLVGLSILKRINFKSITLAPRPYFGKYKREYTIGVRKGHTELMDRLTTGLRAARAGGDYAKIYDKWFANLDPEVKQRAEWQKHLLFGFLVAVALALVSIAFVLFFRAEVNRKTHSLMQSESRFRSLVENLPGAVFHSIKREAWHIDYISEAIERLTGYPNHLFTAGDSFFTSILHPEDRAMIPSRLPSPENPRLESEFRVFAKSGEVRWLRAYGRLTVLEDGLQTIDGIFLDISEQRQVAELLTQHQTRMAGSARLSALGEMAGGIAHEINNPLAIINLRTHQLAMLAAKGKLDQDDVLAIASGIEATSIRISKIVKSLQTVARESEHDPFESVPVRAIIGDAFDLCFQRMKRHGIEVVVEDIPASLEIECRRVQVSQVLINLLNNAFDAVVSLPNRYVRIAARELDEQGKKSVEIAIIDSGTGLTSELAQKIFQPFFTTKGVGKGIGLGLSISKGMIEAHDGHIVLDTSYPTTRFVIVLPKFQPDKEVVPPSPKIDTLPSESEIELSAMI